MSQKRPGFVSGANAKIKLFGKTMAYCADVSYNINVQTIPIEAMGRYEVFSNEPVGYAVDGAFSIIRYTKRAKEAGISKTANNGNFPDAISSNESGSMGEHFDPARLLQSRTFDIEIHEKTSDGDNRVFRISDCRLTRRGMGLNKRGVMVDNYAFVGINAQDEDDTATPVGESGDIDLGA